MDNSRIVPLTPTGPMIDAGAEVLYGHTRAQAREWAKEDKFDSRADEASKVYSAMISAARGLSMAELAEKHIQSRRGPHFLHALETVRNTGVIPRSQDLDRELWDLYVELVNPLNEWPGRSSLYGQKKLCSLRKLISLISGKDQEQVQDEATMSALEATPDTGLQPGANAPTPAAQSAGQRAVACSVCYGTDFDVNGKPCAFPHGPVRVAYSNTAPAPVNTNNGAVCEAVPKRADAAPVNGGERERAIEEAAQIAETFKCGTCGMDGKCAAAIRALERERAADAQPAGGRRINGLGRMTADDDGIVRLQFASEEAAQAFMCDFAPSVEVTALTSPAKVGGDEVLPGEYSNADELIRALSGRDERVALIEVLANAQQWIAAHRHQCDEIDGERWDNLQRVIDFLRGNAALSVESGEWRE